MQLLNDLLGIKDFIPHGYCLSWSPILLWLHVISEVVKKSLIGNFLPLFFNILQMA